MKKKINPKEISKGISCKEIVTKGGKRNGN